MMLTLPELQALMPVIDAGIKAGGLLVFQNQGGIHMQAVLAKLQQMAAVAEAEAEAAKEKGRAG